MKSDITDNKAIGQLSSSPKKGRKGVIESINPNNNSKTTNNFSETSPRRHKDFLSATTPMETNMLGLNIVSERKSFNTDKDLENHYFMDSLSIFSYLLTTQYDYLINAPYFVNELSMIMESEEFSPTEK